MIDFMMAGVKIKRLRLCYFLLFCTLFFCTLLTGCSNKGNHLEYYQMYQIQNIDMTELGDGIFGGMACQEDKIVFSFPSFIDGKRCRPLYQLSLIDREPVLIDWKTSQLHPGIIDVAFDQKHNLYVISMDMDSNQSHPFCLHILNENNEIIQQIDLSLTVSDYGKNGYTLKIDKDGLIFFIGLQDVIVMDDTGKVLCSQDFTEVFLHGYKDNQDVVHVVMIGKDSDFDFVYDQKDHKFIKNRKNKLKNFSDISFDIFDGIDEFSYFYLQDSNETGREIYGVKEDTPYLLCRFSDAGISTNTESRILALQDHKFLYIFQPENGGDQLLMLEPTDKNQNKEKKSIYLAGIGISDELNNAVTQFNMQSTDSQIIVTDYAKVYPNNFEEAYKKLNLTLIGKGQADILCLNNLNKRNLIEKRMLEDLNLYLEESKEINQDEIMDCVLQNCMTSGGEMFFIYPQFEIRTFMKNGTGEVSSVYELLEDTHLERNQKLFLSGDPDGLLYSLIKYNPEHLMDYENKTCSFQDKYFDDVLSILQNFDAYALKSDDLADAVRNKKVKYFQMPIKDMLDYMLYLQMCEYDMEYIGYPTEDGMHPIMQSDKGLGILSTSTNKEYAWDFMEFILDEANYDNLFGNLSFPIRKDSMKSLLEKMSIAETYTKEDGTVIRSVDQYSIGINDYELTPHALSEDDVRKFEQLLERSVICDGIDEQQMDIIGEETALFLAGQQSKERTMDNIQSRLSISIQE